MADIGNMNKWKSKNRSKYLLQSDIFVCSVGDISEETLRKYIENQG